jgi:hypothetical protein
VLCRKAGAKRLVYCLGLCGYLCLFVVIPEGNLPLFSLLLPCLRARFQPCRNQPGQRPNRSALSMVEATEFIAVVFAVIFLLPFLAQKSHVKPPKRLTDA